MLEKRVILTENVLEKRVVLPKIVLEKRENMNLIC